MLVFTWELTEKKGLKMKYKLITPEEAYARIIKTHGSYENYLKAWEELAKKMQFTTVAEVRREIWPEF
jgi:hypothetical protein